MELGMIGLGKMGNFMAQRLMKGGHRVIGFDPNADARKRLTDQGGETIDSLEALPGMLKGPRVLWLMVPAGAIVDQTLDALTPKLQAGDIVIDGGNSNYKDTMRRAQRLTGHKLHYVDCGTSGGVWGLQEGYSM
ncbi:MAG TPA: NAD(P)-binding domain-containing protein, partial [Rhodanobacteraceae bacterium]